jgi:hypothetical protein
VLKLSEARMITRRSDSELLPDENPDIKKEILEVVGEEWLHAKNTWFAGRTPLALIGTPEEPELRDVVRSIKAADFS